jgi:short subunit dehydrogenase-like uncharacterized protein
MDLLLRSSLLTHFYTLFFAALLIVFRSKKGGNAGLITPAAALGSDLAKQVLGNTDSSFKIKELS